MLPEVFLEFRRKAIACSDTIEFAITQKDEGIFRLAKPRRRLDQCIEHDLKIEGRPADDLQNVSGRGLLLEGFTQLIKQPSVLNCDDRLGGEILHQVDLLIGERQYFLAIDIDRSDQFIFLEHWDENDRTSAAEIGDRNNSRIAFEVWLPFAKVFNMYDLPCPDGLSVTAMRMGADQLVQSSLGIRRRGVVDRHNPESVSIVQIECAKLGIAELCSVSEHCLEHRL